MINVEGEQIEVIDAHSHMGGRKKLAIHQIAPIMKFMAKDMLQSPTASCTARIIR